MMDSSRQYTAEVPEDKLWPAGRVFMGLFSLIIAIYMGGGPIYLATFPPTWRHRDTLPQHYLQLSLSLRGGVHRRPPGERGSGITWVIVWHIQGVQTHAPTITLPVPLSSIAATSHTTPLAKK